MEGKRLNDDDLNDDDLPAIMGYSSKCGTMADGSLRIQIDVQPKDAQKAFRMFGTPGTAIALARLTDEVAVEEDRPGKPKKKGKGPFGDYAAALVKTGFFRTPKVWEGIGTDKQYLEWLKGKKSAFSGERDIDKDTGEMFCVPAHVRHVEHGSGTGIKPPYSAIPLTNAEHQLSHQKGDSAIAPRDWWDKMRVKYVSQWAYETLKANMGYDSYTDMHPRRLLEWARQRDLENLLPLLYHTLEDGDGENPESKAASET